MKLAIHRERKGLVLALVLAIALLPLPLLRRPLLHVPPFLSQLPVPRKEPRDERARPMVVWMDAVVEVQARPVVALTVVRARAVVPVAAVVAAPMAVVLVAVGGVVSVRRALVAVTAAGMMAGVTVLTLAAAVASTSVGAAVVRAAGAAAGEDPEDVAQAAVAAAFAEPLGVLLLVAAQGTGGLHLADALAAGRLAAEERAAHLHDPAVNSGRLAVVHSAASSLLLL